MSKRKIIVAVICLLFSAHFSTSGYAKEISESTWQNIIEKKAPIENLYYEELFGLETNPNNNSEITFIGLVNEPNIEIHILCESIEAESNRINVTLNHENNYKSCVPVNCGTYRILTTIKSNNESVDCDINEKIISINENDSITLSYNLSKKEHKEIVLQETELMQSTNNKIYIVLGGSIFAILVVIIVIILLVKKKNVSK